jgi:ribokinase
LLVGPGGQIRGGATAPREAWGGRVDAGSITVEHLPPHPATVRDTTGAGDTFNGVLAAHLAAEVDLATAARTANVAAALSVARTGARAGMPTAAEVAAEQGAAR